MASFSAVLPLSSAILPLPAKATVRVTLNGSDLTTTIVQVITDRDCPVLLLRRGKRVWSPICTPGTTKKLPPLDRDAAKKHLCGFLTEQDAETVLTALLA